MPPSNSIAELLAADIPAPSDFPPADSAPGLRQLDTALRCAICSELLDAPVSLTCGHSFCSICVRIYVSDKAECPTCRKPEVNIGHLRKNTMLEDAITAWKLARPFVLDLLNKVSFSPKPSSGKKRKRTSSSRNDSVSSDGDSEIQFVAGPSTLSPSKKKPPSRQPSAKRKKDDVEGETKTNATNDLVICPVCAQKVRLDSINRHIDASCPPLTQSQESQPETPNTREKKKSNSATEWSKIMRKGSSKDFKDADPLPTVSYNVLKDKQIKDMLAEHGLSTTGDRTTLVRRHKRWVVIYNANLDRSEEFRKSLPALQADMKRWEEECRKANTRESTVKVKEKDYVAHEKVYSSHFNQLVEAARPKKKDEDAEQGLDSIGE